MSEYLAERIRAAPTRATGGALVRLALDGVSGDATATLLDIVGLGRKDRLLCGSDTRTHQGQSIRPGGQARFNPPVLHVLPGTLAQNSGEDSRRRGVSCQPPTSRADRRSLSGATL